MTGVQTCALPICFPVTIFGFLFNGRSFFNFSLEHWINDGLMSMFFFVVGLELKGEFISGELRDIRKVTLPVAAAVFGMLFPAVIYMLLNQGTPVAHGWGIPMATDIAFAVGVLGLLGKRVPFALKIFLLALAIIDDLGAIVVIAIFFSHDLSTTALISAGLAIVTLIIMNRMRITAICAYMVVGLILWASVLKSGVHATLAGVIIGFCVPLKGKNGEEPLAHFEHILAPWCAFVILPLFAFSNAGVSLNGMSLNTLFSPLTLGVTLGLLVGKTLGVFSFSFIAVKLGIAKLSDGINFKQIFAVSMLVS